MLTNPLYPLRSLSDSLSRFTHSEFSRFQPPPLYTQVTAVQLDLLLRPPLASSIPSLVSLVYTKSELPGWRERYDSRHGKLDLRTLAHCQTSCVGESEE